MCSGQYTRIASRLTCGTACGTMNSKSLNKIRRKLERLRAGAGNLHCRELVEVAKSLGRRLSKRGKHPMYVSDQFLQISHRYPFRPDSLNRITVLSILGQLDEDVFRWDELLESDESRR